MRRSERGGATVELAIMSVAFVAVLLFGMYFAEVGYLSLKVQEGANYAMLDATHRRVHKFDMTEVNNKLKTSWKYFKQPEGAEKVGTKDKQEYEDFDGVTQGAPVLTAMMTQASGYDLDCAATGNGKAGDPLRFGMPTVKSKRSFMPAVENYLNKQLFRGLGGVECTSTAKVGAVNFPSAFLENSGGGLAKAQLFDKQPITLCGVGRAKNGQCKGHYGVLVGDWSFEAEPSNSANNDALQTSSGKLAPGGNKAYRTIAEEIYTLNGGGSQQNGGGWTRAQTLMLDAGGFKASAVKNTYNEKPFLMSYSGWEDSFTQKLPQANANLEYNTSGVYLPAVLKSKKNKKNLRYAPCFLGLARSGCQ